MSANASSAMSHGAVPCLVQPPPLLLPTYRASMPIVDTGGSVHPRSTAPPPFLRTRAFMQRRRLKAPRRVKTYSAKSACILSLARWRGAACKARTHAGAREGRL